MLFSHFSFSGSFDELFELNLAVSIFVSDFDHLFDDIVCAELGVVDGKYDGQLTSVPPTGEARYQALVDYAAAHDLDLSESVAYADSASDLPMLEAVGFPVAVNPETRLAGIARKRGWLVENWSKASGSPQPLLPIGKLLSERERKAFVSRERSKSDATSQCWAWPVLPRQCRP